MDLIGSVDINSFSDPHSEQPRYCEKPRHCERSEAISPVEIPSDVSLPRNDARLLMIDNFDSFTYILVDYFKTLGAKVDVYRNNEIDLHAIDQDKYDAIIISPGPKSPNESGISIPLILKFGGKIPILGVCLGHQVIGQAFGSRVVHAPYIMHGKTSLIFHEGKGLLEGIENPFSATRYHSLVIDSASITDEIKIDAKTEDGTVMAISHKILPIYGVQFHPESILTKGGIKILVNFLKLAYDWNHKIAGNLKQNSL